MCIFHNTEPIECSTAVLSQIVMSDSSETFVQQWLRICDICWGGAFYARMTDATNVAVNTKHAANGFIMRNIFCLHNILKFKCLFCEQEMFILYVNAFSMVTPNMVMRFRNVDIFVVFVIVKKHHFIKKTHPHTWPDYQS